MGIIVKFAGRSIWEPTLKAGFCFVAQVRSLEALLDTESGVGLIIADEVDINLAAFENFLTKCIEKLERTNDGEIFALVMGCLQICIALNWKMGGKLSQVSTKLQPLLEEAGVVQKMNWRITSLQPAEEEIDGRTGEVRDMRDWVVYRKK